MASDGSLRIGSIFGISIELNWFFILMVFLFYIASPAFALVWILLFVCVLIHELAHSVTALRNGVRVSRIVLLPFGGASVIDDQKLDPRVEFRISLVGPLMSLFLGGVFGIASALLPMGPLQSLAQTLFILNVFLGIFNIIPAFPMDGGRIFRSWLERRYSLYDATMITAKITKAILALIVLASFYILIWGDYSLFQREYIFLIDLVVVFFIYAGMKSEEDMVTLRKRTEGLRIGSAASRHYAFIKPDAGVGELSRLVERTGEHTVITRFGKGYAIVDLRNRKKVMSAESVSDLAIGIPKVDAGKGIVDGLAVLSGGGYGIAVVERRGRPIGIITFQQVQTYISLHIMGRERRAVREPANDAAKGSLK